MDTRSILEAKLADIDGETEAMTSRPKETANISFGKRVGDGTQMAVDRLAQVAVEEKLLRTRADVLRALAKLDEGTYGKCDVCGQEIPAGRLEVLPWAVLCVQDAAVKR